MKTKFKDWVGAQNQKIISLSLKLKWRDYDIRPLILATTLFLVVTLILSTNFFPQTVRGIELGKPSPKTIKAQRSIEFIDHDKTEELKQQAYDSVEPVYKYDVMVAPAVEKNIQNFFNAVRDTKANEALEPDGQIKLLKEKVDKNISTDVLGASLGMSLEDLQSVEEKTTEISRRIMGDRISKKDIAARRDEFKNIVAELNLDSAKTNVITEVGSDYLEPNYIYDAEATEKERAETTSEVEPYGVKKVKGEIIVREGEVVTTEQQKILEELGLLRSGIDTMKILGTVLLVLLILAALAIYLYSYQDKVFKSPRLILVLSIILTAVILIAKVINPYFSPFLIPVAGLAMLITILFNPQLAIVTVLVASLFTSVIVGNNVQYLMVAILSGIFAVFLVTKITERKNLVQAGFWLSLLLAVSCFAVSAIAGTSFIESVKNSGWGIISGFTSAILTAGALPFLETGFNITTDTKLLELSNPNQPLLRELMMKAPGTYNHSIVIGNIAESAAEAVGANPLLARAGGYYHDIGKIKRPFFFVENQIQQNNPHDRTNPNLSYLIITAHVKEGAELAKKYKLPREIIEIIKQHHGTTLVAYFFHRAKEEGAKQFVDENSYRYPGNTPQSKEAALVMIADAVEAAARTIAKPSPTRLEQLVKKIVQNRLDDGQLDRSDLTLTDLQRIIKVYAQVLSGMYHGRVEYPGGQVVPLKRKTHGGSGK